jgi:hypothetical protein
MVEKEASGSSTGSEMSTTNSVQVVEQDGFISLNGGNLQWSTDEAAKIIVDELKRLNNSLEIVVKRAISTTGDQQETEKEKIVETSELPAPEGPETTESKEEKDEKEKQATYKNTIYFQKKVRGLTRSDKETMAIDENEMRKRLKIGAVVLGQDTSPYPITVTQKFQKLSGAGSNKLSFKGTAILIESEPLLNCIRAVIGYYPAFDFALGQCKIWEPFMPV